MAATISAASSAPSRKPPKLGAISDDASCNFPSHRQARDGGVPYMGWCMKLLTFISSGRGELFSRPVPGEDINRLRGVRSKHGHKLFDGQLGYIVTTGPAYGCRNSDKAEKSPFGAGRRRRIVNLHQGTTMTYSIS